MLERAAEKKLVMSGQEFPSEEGEGSGFLNLGIKWHRVIWTQAAFQRPLRLRVFEALGSGVGMPRLHRLEVLAFCRAGAVLQAVSR